MSPEIIDHSNEIPEGVTAFEFLKTNVSMIATAVPNMDVTIVDIIAEGDRVAIFATFTGTHEGEFMGNPATGNAISFDNADFFRFEDGQIVERWGVSDTLAFMTQLGFMPPLQ